MFKPKAIYFEKNIENYELGKQLLEKYKDVPKVEIENHNNIEEMRLFILIVACIFNIMNKLVKKVSLNTELEASATYVNQINQEENKNLNK